jgi:hypothetical protein
MMPVVSSRINPESTGQVIPDRATTERVDHPIVLIKFLRVTPPGLFIPLPPDGQQ